MNSNSLVQFVIREKSQMLKIQKHLRQICKLVEMNGQLLHQNNDTVTGIIIFFNQFLSGDNISSARESRYRTDEIVKHVECNCNGSTNLHHRVLVLLSVILETLFFIIKLKKYLKDMF